MDTKGLHRGGCRFEIDITHPLRSAERYFRWSTCCLAIQCSTARIAEASGPVAQLGERCLRMAEVTSSSLVGSTPKTFAFAGKMRRTAEGPGTHLGPST